jgi:hypothetical protein
MTRIKTRFDLLIFRSFDRQIFTQGPPEGPSLLLRKLRGEAIDWQAIEAKHTPKTRCHGPCMAVRFKDMFHEKEWKNKEDPHCKQCINRLNEQGKTHRCAKCRQWYARGGFANKGFHLEKLVCEVCTRKTGQRSCIRCGQEKPGTDFAATRWNRVSTRRICLECSGSKTCSACKTSGDVNKFVAEEWSKPDGKRRCKECVPKRCCKCRKARTKNLYNKAEWALDEGKAICNDCDRRRCGKCNKAKMYKDFGPATWELADGSAAYRCTECIRGQRTKGMWVCMNRRCRMQKPHSEFEMAIAKHGNKVNGNSRQCDECLLRSTAEESKQSQKSAEQVQKKSRKK